MWGNGFGRVGIHICNPHRSQKTYHSQTTDCLNEVSCRSRLNSQAWNRVLEKQETTQPSELSDMQSSEFLAYAGEMASIAIGHFLHS